MQAAILLFGLIMNGLIGHFLCHSCMPTPQSHLLVTQSPVSEDSSAVTAGLNPKTAKTTKSLVFAFDPARVD